MKVFHPLIHAACAYVLASSSLSPVGVQAANWSISRVNHMVLSPPAELPVVEMSGVAYLGPSGPNHRFVAATENHGALLQFDLSLQPNGAIAAISNVSAIPLGSTNDFEGVAYTDSAQHSVFLSDETLPGVREVSFTDGAVLQSVVIPPVFGMKKRVNRGFESLARSLDGAVMWTANEEALTVDGPASTASVGTVVRLLKLNATGGGYLAGSQYAYRTEPQHGAGAIFAPQSGLVDLVALPDGTLLTLERSFANLATPVFLNRVFELDLASATDVSAEPLVSGLEGQTYELAAKTLLWSGPADNANGQNLEGLTLGPRLANGSWVLIGVVDDDASDPISANTIVAFTATAVASADFNGDGAVDGGDVLLWQQGLGKAIGAQHTEGDADRDGDVDAADLDIWKSAAASSIDANAFFGTAASAASKTTPEPPANLLAAIALLVAAHGGGTRE